MRKREFLGGAALAAMVAAGQPLRVRAQVRLRYGGDAAFAPFEHLDAQGRPAGFQIDLLAALSEVTGLGFDIALQPWARTEAAFRAGELDVVAMVDTAERRQWARFTHGHATPAFAIYHPARGMPTQGLQDLVGLRIAMLDRPAMRDTLARWLPALPGPFVGVAEPAQALAAVRDGQADVALLPRAYGDPLLPGLGGALMAQPLSLPLQTYAFAVSPARPDLQAQLQAGLDRLEAEGRLEALRLRWLSSHQDLAARLAAERGLAAQRDWTWLVAGGGAATAAVLGTGLWRRGRHVAAERARRTQAEQALAEARALLERSFVQHPDPMLLVEAGSAVVRDVNLALPALLGTHAEALIGQPLPALARHVDATALAALVAMLDTQGHVTAAPLRLIRADGSPRDCLVSAERLPLGEHPLVFCLLRDITDTLAADARLHADYQAQVQAAQQARQLAEQRLAEATRGLAHDLKAPLRAVEGLNGLLRVRLAAGHVDEALVCSQHIERATQRMTALVNALTRLAQVGHAPVQRQSVDMQRLARDTWQWLTLNQPLRRDDARIEALPVAQADPDLCAQVWQNLLDNAFKYSARVAVPRIRVDSHRDGAGQWYRVTDNGAGFDTGQVGAGFQPFRRYHEASQFEGTGVGLSLVQRIVEHHGGELRVRSAPGVGTVVEFRLG